MSYELVSSGQNDAQYVAQLDLDAQARAHGVYPRTIFIALGGTGAKAILHLRRMVLERFGRVDALPGVAYLSVDTEVASASPAPTAGEQKKDPFDQIVAFHAERERVNLNAKISNLLGPNLPLNPHIREWWDESVHLTQGFNVEKGAGQIRPLARLLFFENQQQISSKLLEALARVSSIDVPDSRVNRSDALRVVVVSGWAGGTGSGTFLDMGALIKTTIPESSVSVEGIFALPSVVRSKETGEKYRKAAANGYAALREANYFLSHPFEVRWSKNGRREVIRGLYDRYLMVSGNNYIGTDLGNDDAVYRAIAEALFLDFSAGPMAGWIQGVRINRAQYLKSFVSYQYQLPRPDGTVTKAHADKWLTEFATFGIAKLSFPAWRLLNYAKYDLAAEMAGLMDRAQQGSLTDLVTNHRDRFMHAAGFFQGDMTTEEGGRETHWQVRDALARSPGVGGDVKSIFDHIGKLTDELKMMAEGSYADKSTIPDSRARWREAQRLLGDAASPGSEGDWILQIRKNRAAFVAAVRDALPRVIEEFREKPAVGPSGVRSVMESVLETLGHPAEKARYGDFFRNEVPRLEAQAKEAQDRWERQIKNADEASRGFLFLKSPDTHREAMAAAGEAFTTYWSARFEIQLADEAVKGLEAVKALIREHLGLLEKICDSIAGLKAHFLNCRNYYSAARPSPIARELGGDSVDVRKLLEPFLGQDPEERSARLRLLLQRGLREMGLNTLAAISSKLAHEQDAFRENLAAQAFYALRGRDGWTTAFSGDDAKPIEGFIERNAILRQLPSGNAAEMERLMRELYNAALPLLALHKEGDTARLVSAKTDAFLGFVQGGSGSDEASHMAAAARNSIEQVMTNIHRAEFKPNVVRTSDPTEIILYTEMNAFPAFAMREIYHQGGMRDHYETTLFDESKSEPLHIHRDYYDYQEVVPLSPEEVSRLRRAWKSFVQGLFLGVIRSMPARTDDTRRFVYQMHTRRSALESNLTHLGPEPLVLRRLMHDRGFEAMLQRHIDQEQQRFREAGGQWSHLYALAEYTFHNVFPTLRLASQATTGRNDALGSMAGMALAGIRDDWRAEAGRAGEGVDADFDAVVEQHIRDLARWTQPIACELGKPVPFTLQPQRDERVNVWALTDLAYESVRKFISRGHLPDALDPEGGVAFPRIAINWEVFGGSTGTPTIQKFNYRGPTGSKAHIACEMVADLMRAAPHALHEVIQAGWAGWKDAREVPIIAQQLGTAVPMSSVAPASVPAPPVPAPQTRAEPSFRYALDGTDRGEQTIDAIAAEVRKSPGSQHFVYHPSLAPQWRPAADVSEIAKRLVPDSIPPPPIPGASFPPPPVPGASVPPGRSEVFHYTRDGLDLGQRSDHEIAVEVERAPAARHRVWNKRLGGWRGAEEVPEITRHLSVPPPDDEAGPPPDDE